MKELEQLKIVKIYLKFKGRNNDSDFKINDISVSRFHSILRIFDKNFYLEDNKSKFGTLIQIDNEFNLLPEKQLGLQIGKYLVTFNVKKTFCAYFTCYS